MTDNKLTGGAGGLVDWTKANYNGPVTISTGASREAALQARIEQLEAAHERTAHSLHNYINLCSDLMDREKRLEAALRGICDGPRDADKSYPELLAEVRIEARAALAGEKKDEGA
jgi:hypothetical protein